MDEFQKALDWLVVMARTNQAWKEYAWSEAKRLEGIAIFQGIKDALVAEMKRANK